MKLSIYAMITLMVFVLGFTTSSEAEPTFKVIAMAERGGLHEPYVVAAHKWLNEFAKDNNFTVDWIEDAKPINEKFLSNYKLFVQVNHPPYAWSDMAKAAFEKYIDEGKIGWIGFHHATLLGEFDGFKVWPWFRDFMGGILFKNYIADFATATVNVEDEIHPCLKNVPSSFVVKQEEWYTYDKSPRANVKVLVNVNESSYDPPRTIKMGDHPVIWSNEHKKAKNIYVFMGHHPDLFENDAYTTIYKNAIFWASNT